MYCIWIHNSHSQFFFTKENSNFVIQYVHSRVRSTALLFTLSVYHIEDVIQKYGSSWEPRWDWFCQNHIDSLWKLNWQQPTNSMLGESFYFIMVSQFIDSHYHSLENRLWVLHVICPIPIWLVVCFVQLLFCDCTKWYYTSRTLFVFHWPTNKICYVWIMVGMLFIF